MDKDYMDYKDFDMSGAKRGIHPIIARLQQNNSSEVPPMDLSNLFETDILEAMKSRANRPQELLHINAVLRALLNTMPTT